jgi:mono/diheme cytochrome c family protein
MRAFRSMVAVLGVLTVASAASAADSELGKKVFAQRCAGCHGADGKGNAKMATMLKTTIPDLTSIGPKSDAELVKFISEGKKPMPSFGKSLSQDELTAVLHYTKGLGGPQTAGKK